MIILCMKELYLIIEEKQNEQKKSKNKLDHFGKTKTELLKRKKILRLQKLIMIKQSWN